MAEIETINGFDIAPNGYVKQISLDELATVSNGVYTLGTVQIDDAIQFPRVNNRGIIIVDTVFNINTPVLFPAYLSSTYFILPSFVGCVFNNMTSERVLISSGSTNTVGSRFTGCNFINVDAVGDGGYIQDFNLTGCYVRSYDTFLDAPSTTVQARFVNCTVESESNALISSNYAVAYFSGTYEGNAAKDFFFVETNIGNIEFNSCWFESCKMLSLVGGNNVTERSVVSLSSCNVNGYNDSTPVMTVTNPEYVSLYINGSRFSAYSTNSRFTDVLPDSFERVVGSFTLGNADTYALPIGGVNAQSKGYATLNDVSALENKRFIDRRLLLSQTVIDGGGITMTDLPVGGYLVLVGQGDYSNFSSSAMYTVTASVENSTIARAIKIIDGTTAYTNNYTLTPTKANASDTTFSLNINATTPQGARICMIRIF